MKKLFINVMVLCAIGSVTVEAFEVNARPVVQQEARTLAQDIQALKDFIIKIPQRFEQIQHEMEQAQGTLGNIERSITQYLVINKDCATGPASLQRMCEEHYHTHNFGEKLRAYKHKVTAIIRDVEKKLREVNAEKDNIVMYHQMVDSLESMQGLEDEMKAYQ